MSGSRRPDGAGHAAECGSDRPNWCAGDELDDERTGIQVFCRADEATVQVPYWHTGAEARHVITVMYRIAGIIEQETGLQGYDPQIEVPPAEVGERLDAAVAAFDNVASSFARRGARTA